MRVIVGIIVLFGLLLSSIGPSGVGEAGPQADTALYLPVIFRGWPPTPTPPITPTHVPSPTATLSPTAIPATTLLPTGQVINFKGWQHDTRMLAIVTGSERRSSLTDYWGSTYYASGIFLVGFVNIANVGLQSDSVGRYTSFRVKDSANRLFDLASLNANMAAMDSYNRKGLYDDVQPGMTIPMVFVFDVLPYSYSPQLQSLAPW